ncbi:uncharacterized protein LOC142775313 isoform X3 [Rhipicephalus microplus]|uniref:uncharacterized protein LOC142775313 isoform X3 n=1 Tax=Rhipicephalus microplus TaxID=6941 RepID=UPI003F6A6309
MVLMAEDATFTCAQSPNRNRVNLVHGLIKESRPARRRRMGQSLSNMRPAQPYTTFLVFSETTYQCSAEDTQLCSELHGGSAEEATLSLKLHGGPAEEARLSPKLHGGSPPSPR